jgi:putative ABC transport system substrate-binding protein
MSSRLLERGLQHARRLSVGVVAILATSAILLWADRDSRNSADAPDSHATRVPRVALVQHASIEPLDDGVRGILDALEQRGYADGEGIALSRYNAQGDFATANTIAKAVVGDNLDLIITVSTLSMQTVASANRLLAAPRRHLFGITTNPFDAGIGVNRENPLDHPAHLAGVGSNPPIRELFELVKRIQPSVRAIGLVWNPAEANSEAATLLAREVVRDLGLTLVEGNAESSTAAGEVTRSVLARGVDLLWLSTDVTTTAAQDVMISAAKQAGVPVVSSLPASAEHGALIGLGSSYYDVGVEQGQMAADILEGRDPETIPVLNWTPSVLYLNLTALNGLRASWTIPNDVTAMARIVIGDTGRFEQDVPVPAAPPELQWIR